MKKVIRSMMWKTKGLFTSKEIRAVNKKLSNKGSVYLNYYMELN